MKKEYIIGAVALAAVLGVGGYFWWKSKSDTSSDTTSDTSSDTTSDTTNDSGGSNTKFLNGTWKEEYTFPDGTKGSDVISISGNVITYNGKPEFDIVSKKYDAATKTLALSYNRKNSTDKFVATFDVDANKKVLTGSENDGQIKLVWTKQDYVNYTGQDWKNRQPCC